MDIQRNVKNSFFSEGLIIAVITSYIYLVAYLYEYGYCSNFGVPKYFISPSLTTLFVSASSIGFLIFTSANFIGFTLPFFRKSFNEDESNANYRKFFFMNAVLLVIAIVLFRAYGLSFISIGIILGMLLLMNIFVFGVKILKTKKMPLKERISSSTMSDDDPFDIWGPIINLIGHKGLICFLLFIGSMLLAYVSGNSDAKKQQIFLTTEIAGRTHILVRKYNELLIFAPFNREDGSFSTDFKLKNISSDSYMMLTREELGEIYERGDDT